MTDIKLPPKGLGIFDRCPRGQEDWLCELLDEYAKKAVEANRFGAENWAELHTLREAVKGPDGFKTWQEAATAERVRRVKAESLLRELEEKKEPSKLEVEQSDAEQMDRLSLLHRIDLAMSGSCTCLTKTPRPYFHRDSCVYRVLNEAKEAIQSRPGGRDKLKDDAVNLLFALRDAWPYVHQWCSIESIKNKITDLIRKHGDFADTYVPKNLDATYEPLNPKFKERWIKALISGSYVQSGNNYLRQSSSFSALGVAKDIQGAKWKLGKSRGVVYQDLLSGETEKYVPVLSQEKIDPEALKCLERIQSDYPFDELARWIDYNL